MHHNCMTWVAIFPATNSYLTKLYHSVLQKYVIPDTNFGINYYVSEMTDYP